MDNRQRVVVKTFTKEQLQGMSVDDLVALIGEAGPGAKFRGTAVVRQADGNIRYDDERARGQYAEGE